MLRIDHRVYVAAALLFATVLTVGLLTTGSNAGTSPRPRPAPAAPAAPAPRPGHLLVELLGDHAVHARPNAGSRRIGAVRGRRPLTRVRTRLPVLERRGRWVHVRLPGRPNGHAGWISADRTRRAFTEWRIAVRLSQRLVTVYRRGEVQGRFRTVVGRADTPTPRGHFFVEEGLRISRVGAPFALAVSARSNVFQTFAGGPGQVALHGTTGLRAKVGSAASHGCLRLSPRAMRWLSKRIGPGVPLTVTR